MERTLYLGENNVLGGGGVECEERGCGRLNGEEPTIRSHATTQLLAIDCRVPEICI